MASMISGTAAAMPRSGIREVMDLAWQTPNCIHLEVGEPDFATPTHIIDAAADALRGGWTKYTPSAGIPVLCEAIADKVTRNNHIPARTDQITVTAGGVEAVYTALLAVTDPGDAVLVPDPGWPNYRMMIHLLHLDTRLYPLRREERFIPLIDDLEALVTPRTRAIIVNSPSNPVGSIIGPERLAAIGDFAWRHSLVIVSDEAYEQITFEPGFVSTASVADPGRVISCFTFSKSYAMTGWRIGYLVAPPELAPIAQKLQEPIISCVSAPTQMAALAALRGPQAIVEEMTMAYRRRRDAVITRLDRHSIEHADLQGAFYAWVRIAGLSVNVRQFALRLLVERKVAVAPGSAFGPSGEGWIRLSLATAESQLLEGVDQLIDFMAKG
jgi:aspartate aminotransferase